MNQRLSPQPDSGTDIHPWMPANLHDRHSQLGRVCAALDVSIHDREKVYAEMQRVQKEINFKTA